MKTLYLIRHAKSSWDFPELTDFDRPLNKRGLKDAPFMAALLEAKGFRPDKIVSSPANRAYTTAKYFAAAFHIHNEEIKLENDIYEAFVEDLQDIVTDLDNGWDTVFLFGHNPGFTSFANRFTTEFIDNIPTCGIVRIMSTENDWSQFVPGKARVSDHYFPKDFH